ncbi:MAG: CTP-dependent riboflavin kinase [Candidatus Lokiarchaeota archaeon]|nr:CTP-dependent riboflavin kinase [Candidatus Lokiarchaeota archaeon]
MSKKGDISPENYANWFALYQLCKHIEHRQTINISSVEFGKLLNLSQQTASRRINDLIELGWIKRKLERKTQKIVLTKEGSDAMLLMYKNLKNILESIVILGTVQSGMKEGAYYVSIKGYFDQFQERLGFLPYKGTLNLELNNTNIELLREKLKNLKPVVIAGFKDDNSERTYGIVDCYDCVISRIDNPENKIKAAILDIKRTHHKKNIIEILAKPYLRDYFNLKDGDKLIIELNINR